jgi:hypothetical protein
LSALDTIYVALLAEATPVWRPVSSIPLGSDLYEIVGPIPEDEVWEFQPGDIVRCQDRNFADGESGLTAIELAAR